MVTDTFNRTREFCDRWGVPFIPAPPPAEDTLSVWYLDHSGKWKQMHQSFPESKRDEAVHLLGVVRHNIALNGQAEIFTSLTAPR